VVPAVARASMASREIVAAVRETAALPPRWLRLALCVASLALLTCNG
jgi:hypothetical protein